MDLAFYAFAFFGDCGGVCCDGFFGVLQWKWMAWFITVFAGASMVSDLRFYSGKDINLKHSVPFIVILGIMFAIVLISYSPPEVLFLVMTVSLQILLNSFC